MVFVTHTPIIISVYFYFNNNALYAFRENGAQLEKTAFPAKKRRFNRFQAELLNYPVPVQRRHELYDYQPSFVNLPIQVSGTCLSLPKALAL